jgi:hypothetical protein
VIRIGGQRPLTWRGPRRRRWNRAGENVAKVYRLHVVSGQKEIERIGGIRPVGPERDARDLRWDTPSRSTA